jgi:hypothetical protein
MPEIPRYEGPRVGVPRTGAVSVSGAGAQALEGAARTVSYHARQGEAQYSQVASGMRAAGAANAQGIRALAQGTADVAGAIIDGAARYQEQQTTTKFYADSAAFGNRIERAWNETRARADINDPSVIEKFNTEVLEPELEKFRAGYGDTKRGRELTEGYTSRLTDHMLGKQLADQATAAGSAAVLNVGRFASVNQDTLVNDPTSLSFIQGMTMDMIADQKANPYLTEPQRVKLDELQAQTLKDNAKAALYGISQKDPAAAKAALTNGFGKEWFDERDRREMDAMVRAQENFRKAADESARVEKARLNHEAVAAATNELMANSIDPNTGYMAIGPSYFEAVKQIALMPDAPAGTAQTLVAFGQSQTKRALDGTLTVTDPATVEDFNARMVLPPGDERALTPEAVMLASNSGLLSKRDTASYMQIARELQKDPAKRDAYSQYTKMLASLKSSITKSSPLFGSSPEQDQMYGAFQRDTRALFDQAYANGTWKDLLDPRSQSFIGRKDFIAPYMLDTKAGLQNLSNSSRSGTTAIITPPPFTLPGQPAPKEGVGKNSVLAPEQEDGSTGEIPLIVDGKSVQDKIDDQDRSKWARKPGETIEQWKARRATGE